MNIPHVIFPLRFMGEFFPAFIALEFFFNPTFVPQMCSQIKFVFVTSTAIFWTYERENVIFTSTFTPVRQHHVILKYIWKMKTKFMGLNFFFSIWSRII